MSAPTLTHRRPTVVGRPRRLQTGRELPTCAREVRDALEYCANPDGTVVVTRERLAALLGRSERHVQKGVQKLKDLEEVMVTGGGYRGRCNEYVLTWAAAQILHRARKGVERVQAQIRRAADARWRGLRQVGKGERVFSPSSLPYGRGVGGGRSGAPPDTAGAFLIGSGAVTNTTSAASACQFTPVGDGSSCKCGLPRQNRRHTAALAALATA